MLCPRRRCFCVLVLIAAVLLGPLGLARTADSAFPFGTEGLTTISFTGKLGLGPGAHTIEVRATATAGLEVVLLDITLPDGDGASWLSSLRERGLASFPVIALTGVTADEDRRRIERSGVRAVLPKPVNVPLLFETLRECVQSARR